MKRLFLACMLLACMYSSVRAGECDFEQRVDTGIAPYLDSTTTFRANYVKIRVAVPVSYASSNYTFAGSNNQCAGNGAWSTLDVPQSSLASNCYVMKGADLLWSNIYNNCGGKRTEDKQYVTFLFNIVMSSNQKFTQGVDDFLEESVSIDRPLYQSVLLQIRFPKYITVQSNSTKVTNYIPTVDNKVDNTTDNSAAVGRRAAAQAVLLSSVVTTNTAREVSVTDPTTGQTSTVHKPADADLNVVLVTTTTYPDIITASALIGDPGDDVDTTVTSISQDCPAIAGSLCKQYWKLYAHAYQPIEDWEQNVDDSYPTMASYTEKQQQSSSPSSSLSTQSVQTGRSLAVAHGYRSLATFTHTSVVASNSTRCTFSGFYNVTFTIGCQTGYTGECNPTYMTVSLDLDTGNFCPEALAGTSLLKVTLNAVLKTYSDSAFSVMTNRYRLRHDVHGEVVVDSPEASIQSTTIKHLTLMQDGLPDMYMIANYSLTDAGKTAFCTYNNSGALGSSRGGVARFICNLRPSQIVLPARGNIVALWGIVTEVVFAHTESVTTPQNTRTLIHQSQKRLVSFNMHHEHHSNVLHAASNGGAGGVAEALTAIVVQPAEKSAKSMDRHNHATASSASSLSLHTISMVALFVCSVYMLF